MIKNSDIDILNKRKGVISVVIAALLFGFSPVLVNLAKDYGSNAESMVFYRNLFAIPMAVLWMHFKKNSPKVKPKIFLNLLWIGVFGVCAASLTLYQSYNYVGMGVATVLHFLYPVFAALIALLIYHDKIPKRRAIALTISCIGLLFFLQNGGGSMYGVFLALVSALTYAIYMVGMEKHGVIHLDTAVMTFWFAVIVSITMFVYGMYTETVILTPSPIVIGYALVVSLCTSFGATALLQIGVRYLSAGKAAILCLLEPVSGVFFGWIFLGELITVNIIIGSVIILGSLLIMLSEKKN